MIDAVDPQPGQRMLELAAGLGETGFLAAEMVAPVGGVITSDQADAMLDGARKRAGELNLTNVEFQVLNAEWIDLPVASVDIVFCRWGYMLMADPAAALAEARRVLRPEGHVALAVWDAIEHNPWALLPATELLERGLMQPPEPRRRGRSRWATASACAVCSNTLDLTRCGSSRSSLIQRPPASRSSGRRRSTSHASSTTRCSHVPRRRSPRSAPVSPPASSRSPPSDGSLEIPMRTLAGWVRHNRIPCRAMLYDDDAADMA